MAERTQPSNPLWIKAGLTANDEMVCRTASKTCLCESKMPRSDPGHSGNAGLKDWCTVWERKIICGRTEIRISAVPTGYACRTNVADLGHLFMYII